MYWSPRRDIRPLLSKQTTDPPQHAVLLGIIWMVFAWDFEDCRKSSSIGIDSVSYSVGNLRAD